MLELWSVTDNEGLCAPRKVEEGRMPPVNKLAPGEYVLCDAGGNLMGIVVRDLSDERVPGAQAEWPESWYDTPAEEGAPPF